MAAHATLGLQRAARAMFWAGDDMDGGDFIDQLRHHDQLYYAKAAQKWAMRPMMRRRYDELADELADQALHQGR